jgi:hypothetical protein
MRKMIALASLLLLAACSKPTDIVLGPDPLKQMAEQGDQFKKLPEEDRMLLVGYLGQKGLSQALGGKDEKPATGRTVGEVLVDARAWKVAMVEKESMQKKKDEAAAALKDKTLAERKAIIDKLGEVVTVAVVGKKVRPQDYSNSRLYDFLMLDFAVQNKTDKAIRQLKGRVYISDATGTELGSLGIDFDKPIGAHATVKTNTGYGWDVKRFHTGTIEKIADAQFDGMQTRFEVLAIAYTNGEILKAPELN